MCGQLDQIMMQIPTPFELSNHRFADVYRLFCVHKVLCIGLYRHPHQAPAGLDPSAAQGNGALLPYVFVAPSVRIRLLLPCVFVIAIQGDSIVRDQDKLYVYGTAKDVEKAVAYARENAHPL